jgi:alpha-L-arabinofuranosidase
MSNQARLVLDPAFAVGLVDPRLFGSFVEHVGRCVYTGIYEPGHPAADRDGLRTDVLALIRELGVTVIRYPGGNFVSGYNWEDGVGPAARRPARLDPAWRSIETNEFGLGEFMSFLGKLGPVEPMLAVNLGTRGVAEAVQLLEYANHPGGTARSDLRISHGGKDPYGIRLWCLGNEMDGPWQIGHKSADDYGRLATAAAQAMRLTDPEIQLVACGSSSQAMPTFGAWEATVLGHAYDTIDYVSMHAYYEEKDGDRDSFLASAVDMETFIRDVTATCDHVAARLKSRKKIGISFDEWNVWYSAKTANQPVRDWATAPRLLEDVYSVTDAVVFGSLLIALLRHADRVRVACLAQLVNAIAPIMTEPGGPAWRQTTFYPFALASRYGRGTVLVAEPECPVIRTACQGEVPVLHATAVIDDKNEEVTVFAVNRDRGAPLDLVTEFRGLRPAKVLDHRVLADPDEDARNTAGHPHRVTPMSLNGTRITDGSARVVLPPMSWNMIRFA